MTATTPLDDPMANAANLPRERTMLWRYLRALGARPDEADDLCQDVLLAACSLPVPAPDEARAAFLRGVARNHWLRSRRWWQRRREREIAAAVEELWLDAADRDDGEGLLAQLGSCLERLEQRSRTALERHYRDGLDWHEVGHELGLRANGIKTLAQRARRVLRDCIERSKQ